MPYLTYSEYKSFLFAEVDEIEFDRLLNRASDVLDNVTGDFYQFNVLETDITYRQRKFKKAVACQIDYFHEMGATTSHGLNEPATVSIGRTSMSSGAKGSKAEVEPTNKVVSQDALSFLEGTGLLYRGIGVG